MPTPVKASLDGVTCDLRELEQVERATALGKVPRDAVRNFPHTKRVGSYLVGKMINKGSFAKVMEGMHISTGEKVAIKVIDKKKARQDAYVLKNMKREPRIHQMIRHPYIVLLLETLETENCYYMVMELCAGGDLMDRICEHKRLEEKEVRRYTRQILSAVDHLHTYGIVHRDLKIENFLLDEHNNIKIVDFGLSNTLKLDSLSPDLLNTQCGSPAYAAPELLAHRKYGPKVDVWSVEIFSEIDKKKSPTEVKQQKLREADFLSKMKILLIFTFYLLSGPADCSDVIGYSGGSVFLFSDMQWYSDNNKFICKVNEKECTDIIRVDTKRSQIQNGRFKVYANTKDIFLVLIRKLKPQDAGTYTFGLGNKSNYTVNLQVYNNASCGVPKIMFAYPGQNISIICNYPEVYKNNYKYVITVNYDSGITDVVNTNTRIQNERFSISDDKNARVVSVNISDVREADEVFYLFGVWYEGEKLRYYSHYGEILLHVTGSFVIIITVCVCVVLLLIGWFALMMIYKLRRKRTQGKFCTWAHTHTYLIKIKTISLKHTQCLATGY
ncbi:Hormonally up-regulated neu tumor-associated kinase [Bagarius yarrelli]|uniref:non-specific serine/threonine protein kinase n=1 Tax=Bagarius yarrelli TaxID=175774 RepID=A0A556UYT7_BAGYA|nr:Hormonally up-regulated neu tumor-associated kinase [Bagarius yarrelli]